MGHPIRYACDEEWSDGRYDCEPPEPQKLWLTITEEGEEYAVIILRKDAFGGREKSIKAAKGQRLLRARKIVAALNSHVEAS